MTALTVFIAAGYLGIGLNRARAYGKARRRVVDALLADPSSAAASALHLRLALDMLPTWKRLSVIALDFVVDVTAWPVSEVLEYRDRRRRPDYRPPMFRDPRWRGSEEDLTPEYHSRRVRRRSLATCAVSAYLVGVATLTTPGVGDAAEIKIVAWVVVLGTVARQVEDMLDSNFVLTVARRSGQPLLTAYRDVLVAAGADLLTLTFSSVVLLRWGAGQPVRAVWFEEQLLAVLKGGHIADLRHALAESPSAVLLGIASVAFYASLLTPLKNTVGRRRTGDDMMAAAENALRRGKPDRARRLFELGGSRDPSVRSSTRVTGLLALSKGDVLDAWKAAQTMVRQYRPEQNVEELRQREDGLFVLQNWCGELGISPQPSILELARQVPVRDSMMACLVVEYDHAVLPYASPGARAASLEKLLDASSWPLAFSVVRERDGDVDGAAQLLPAAERVAGLDLLFRNQVFRSQQAARDQPSLTGETFPARLEADARALLADVATSDVDTWPEWLRSAFARALTVPLVVGEAVGLDDELAQELTAARKAIAGELAGYAEVAVVRNILHGNGADRLAAEVRSNLD